MIIFALNMKQKSHLTQGQRYKIEAYLNASWTQKSIAEDLGVHKSTISREISRNQTKRGVYRAAHAQMLADERKERFARPRRFTEDKRKFIDDKLSNEQWSPGQIVGYCKKEGKEMVSAVRIYEYIHEDKERGGELYTHLRHKLKHRKRPVGSSKTRIKDRVGIEHRPKIVDEKGRFGDWEIDTIMGKDGRGAILTIVERTTGFLLMEKLEKGKDSQGVKQATIRQLLPYKESIHTITSDNGSEFACHKQIAEALDVDFYFADPYSSWQRGLNEYTNKLVRQYIPKKTDFNQVSGERIKQIQYKINRRPREKLKFNSPTRVFFSFIFNKVALAT